MVQTALNDGINTVNFILFIFRVVIGLLDNLFIIA